MEVVWGFIFFVMVIVIAMMIYSGIRSHKEKNIIEYAKLQKEEPLLVELETHIVKSSHNTLASMIIIKEDDIGFLEAHLIIMIHLAMTRQLQLIRPQKYNSLGLFHSSRIFSMLKMLYNDKNNVEQMMKTITDIYLKGQPTNTLDISFMVMRYISFMESLGYEKLSTDENAIKVMNTWITKFAPKLLDMHKKIMYY